MQKRILVPVICFILLCFSSATFAQKKAVTKKTTTSKNAKAPIRKAKEQDAEGQVKREEPPVPEYREEPPMMSPPSSDNLPIPPPQTSEGRGSYDSRPMPPPEREAISATEIYQVVEQQAVFMGGISELMKYIDSNKKYPAIAVENGIQGRVVLKFIVEKDGSLSDIKILKGVHELLDKEAIRVVKAMPNWTPGKQSGQTVRSYFTLPISFKLEEVETKK